MAKIRKRKKPTHYTSDNDYCSKEDFLKRRRSIQYELSCGDRLEDIFSNLEYVAWDKYKISSLKKVGVSPSDICFDTCLAYSWSDETQAIFEVSVNIADMNQEAIDHLWAQQDKENKKIVASYEKRFAKWKEWHDEFGEAVAAQEKEVAEKALKKAQANLEKARARVDSLSEEEKS